MAKAQKQKLYRKAVRTGHGFRNSVVKGFATLLTVSTPTHSHLRYRAEDPNRALGGDLARVGNDMRAVIRRECDEEAAR